MPRGPVWGAASEDLNATILVWPPGEGPDEHANAERDVLFVVLQGGATLTVDDEPHELGPGDALIVPKRTRRRVVAGADGVRYLTAHLCRGGLQIRRASTAREAT
jgi:quercetin dioxygenase-like cupin family protein